MSKRWKIVSAVGYGVLFSLALSSAVKIVCWLFGVPISESIRGTIFLVSSVVTGAIAAFLSVRILNAAEAQNANRGEKQA